MYGNSMVEAYEEHESSQERGSIVDDDDGVSSNVVEDKQASGGILKTATAAVLKFVKETAEKLVKIEATGNSGNVSNANLTNSTKYIGPPQQGIDSETPKTIVQLMDHEDFEASCHEASDEVLDGDKCLPGMFCSSMGSSASSYQIFFEIVYNVCRKDFRNAKACFSNLTKNIALNKSATVPAFKLKSSSEEVGTDKEDTLKKNELVKNGFQSDSSNDEEHSDKHTEVEITENTDKMAVFFSPSSSTVRSSEAKISENTPVTPIILPSSSSSQPVTTDAVTPDNMNHPSSPTPLAQPPLAVQQLLDTEEPPTEPTLTNTEGLQGNNENPVVKSNELISDSSEVTTTTVVNDVQLSATKHITPNQVTTSTISSDSIASVSQDKLISSMANGMATVDGDIANQESHFQEKPGYDGEKLMLETIKGSKEELQPNPHVDVLMITLTDSETKEGKAEPEHVDKSESEKNETLKDAIMNDRDEPNEPTSQVDSENSKTLDIDGSESVKNDVLRNDMNEKSAAVKIASKKESESEQHITTQKENENNEGEQDNDITMEISSNVDEKTEHSYPSKDSETISHKCDPKEYEVETFEEGTKLTRKNIQTDLDSLGAAEPEPGPANLVGNGQMNNKKESIFVAMSRKIKALEQNVTMTNLFLEELSQRY